MSMMKRQVVSQGGDTLDLICWRELGRTAGVTEQVIEMNPQLTDADPILPSGSVVTLPRPESAATGSEDKNKIRLW